MSHLYAIALGSNRRHGRFGRPQQVIKAALAELDSQFGLLDSSPIVLNPAHGPAGRDFANAVALIGTALAPPQLLVSLKTIERSFGRRAGRRWGPRVLDLDIVAWSGGKWRSRRLTVPHPLAAARPFVIGPLAAIAPDWRLGRGGNARHHASRLARARPRR